LDRQVLRELEERVVAAGLLDLLAAPVAPVVVVRGVRHEPIRLALDQRRPAAVAGAAHGLLHGPVAGEHIVPVHRDAREPVAGRADGHALHGHLLGERHGDRVAVVLAHEDDRQVMDPCEVHSLVHVPFARGALAEPRGRDGGLSA